MSDKVIQVLQPVYGEEEAAAVAEVLRTGWVGLGPKTRAFEEEFAKYVGCDYVVGLNSGTAALHLAALALQLQPGDEVIVTPITFVSTVHVIRYCGATPVFADVEPDTLNLDAADVTRKITDRTRAIFCVHYSGHPCDMAALHSLAEPRGLYVVEDAAHACGAEYKGAKIGSTSELTCFSFHAVKNLAMGEGGAITCNSDWYARYFTQMRWLGISRDTFSRSSEEKVYAWQYWVERPVEKEYAKSSWHLYVVKLPTQRDRDAMIRHLKALDIAPGVHYYPINLHPVYKDIKSEVPVTNAIWKRILTLPLHLGLTPEDQNRVIEAVRSFPVGAAC